MSSSPDRVAARRRVMGERLRDIRESQAMPDGSKRTQEKVAQLAGLDRSFYVEVESGKHSLTVDRLFAVADALGVTASELLDGIE